jgi:hypothetical protein
MSDSPVTGPRDRTGLHSMLYNVPFLTARLVQESGVSWNTILFFFLNIFINESEKGKM